MNQNLQQKIADHYLRICFLFNINYFIVLLSLQCIFIIQREIQKGKFESCYNCSFNTSEHVKDQYIELRRKTRTHNCSLQLYTQLKPL